MNSNEQEARYIIAAGAAQQIVNYLQQRPYAEVVGLIDIFRRLEMLPLAENNTADDDAAAHAAAVRNAASA